MAPPPQGPAPEPGAAPDEVPAPVQEDGDPEGRLWEQGVRNVAGVDEVGRGPLAGPVVAAAVVLPPFTRIDGVDDSKVLTADEREALEQVIQARALAVGVGAASVREIERHNILGATVRAMDRALCALGRCTPSVAPSRVLVDGPPLSALPWDHEGVIGGDGRVHSVSCASVVAKVVRDRLMCRLAQRHPSYGWERNAGYGTPEHSRALRECGPTPHHRRTFSGVQPQLDLDG